MRSGVQLLVATSFALLLLASAADAGSPSAAVLAVSTTADAINGQVSSPAALIAHPGPDGISLREAITQMLAGLPGLSLVEAEQSHPMPFAHPVATYDAGAVIVAWHSA